MKAIAKATKKAEKKVEDFVKHHKKELLIAGAVVAAACGAYVLTGALAGGAAAAANPSQPRRKEDEEGDKTSVTSSPAAPPPLPDWVENLLKSATPNFSPTTASDAEIENAKLQVHNSWETLNHLKNLTEADLAHLKKEDSKFNPTETAIELVVNTVLNEAQRREFARTSSPQQNWHNLIQTGHQRIDQAFSAASAYKAATIASIQPPPQPPAFSLFDKIKLGLEIIGRGMMEPELLDTDTRLDVFLKDRNITAPLNNPGQTISEFVFKINSSLETIGRGSIDPELLDPNSPWDIHFKNLIENRNPNDSSILKNITQHFTWEKIFPPTPDLPYPDILTGIQKDCTSKRFKIDGINKDGMLITWINGMLNTVLEDSAASARYIQKFGPENLCIHAIYNHSNGVLDFIEAFKLNYRGFSPNTQNLLIQEWTEFHEQNKDRPNAKTLHFCHSQGAIDTKNALLRLPEEIRKRVIVIAIAPANIVPRRLCYESYNYASKNDLVPRGELLALYWQAFCGSDEAMREELLMHMDEIQKELIWLDPHESATGFDHEFQSPTFAPIIQDHQQEYHDQKGEYR